MSILSDFLPKFTPLNGVGAFNDPALPNSGHWPISITGNAGTVTNGVYLTTTQTLSNKTLTAPILNSPFAVGLVENSVTMTGNIIDLSKGNVFIKTISSATTFSVSNVPASGKVASFILKLTNGGAATVTYMSGVKWGGAKAPVLTNPGVDNLGFYTHDGGATWQGFLLSKDSK